MFMWRNMTRNNFKSLVILVVFILITIISYICIYISEEKLAEKDNLDRLYLSGETQYEIIDDLTATLKYEIKFYSKLEGVQKLDINTITREMTFIKAYRPVYDNILVIDNEKHFIYGYIEDRQKFFSEGSIKEAFNGKLAISDFQVNEGLACMYVSNPITDDSGMVKGIICLRILQKDISSLIKNDRLQDDTECFIVDKKGNFITESKFKKDTVGKEKIDIDRLKLNIDYSSNTPYLSYRGVKVYGRYFLLQANGETLIIEKEAKSKDGIMKTLIIISIINTIMEILIFMFIERWFNKNKRKIKL